jgi:hypothetical protein
MRWQSAAVGSPRLLRSVMRRLLPRYLLRYLDMHTNRRQKKDKQNKASKKQRNEKGNRKVRFVARRAIYVDFKAWSLNGPQAWARRMQEAHGSLDLPGGTEWLAMSNFKSASE